MHHARRRTQLVVGALGLAVAATPVALGASPATAAPSAASYGAGIGFDGADYNASAPATCDPALGYTWAVQPTTDDGGGKDWFVITTVDGNGVVQDVDYKSGPANSSTYTSSDTTDAGTINALTSRPLTVALYDVTYDPSTHVADDNTQEAYDDAVAHGRLLGSDTFDPSLIAKNSACSSLPMRLSAPDVTGVRVSPARVTRRTRPVLDVSVVLTRRKAPTGTVTFAVTNGFRRVHHHRVARVLRFTVPLNAGTNGAVPFTDGTASVTLPRLRKGRHAVTAVYHGDHYNTAASSFGRFRVFRR